MADESVAFEPSWTLAVPRARQLSTCSNCSATVDIDIGALGNVFTIKAVGSPLVTVLAVACVVTITIVAFCISAARRKRFSFTFIYIDTFAGSVEFISRFAIALLVRSVWKNNAVRIDTAKLAVWQTVESVADEIWWTATFITSE